MTYDHVTIVVDGGRAKDEPGDVRRDFLPAVMFDNSIWQDGVFRFRIRRLELVRKQKLSVSDARGPDLEGLSHELVLRVDLSNSNETAS